MLPGDALEVQKALSDFLEGDLLRAPALFLLARCHVLRDDFDGATSVLRSLLEHDADNMPAKIELAKLRMRADEPREAIKLLAEVTSARPEVIESWRLLSDCLRQDGQADASKDASKQYEMIRTFYEKLNAAEQKFATGDFQTADAMCRQLLELVPTEVHTLRLLAKIARRFGHPEFSTTTLLDCIDARPADAALRLDYAYSLLANRQHQEALEQCQQLIELAPEVLEVYELKAELLFNLSQFDDAIEIYRELTEVPAKRALSLLHLGKVLKTVGDTREATRCYQRAIESEATLAQAYWELADLKTYKFSADEIEAMRALLGNEQLSPLNKVLVEFALGKAFEDAGEFERSFQHYDSANSSYADIRHLHYSSQNDLLKSFFTMEYFSARNQHGDEADAPIFVVGLPRSGSTLIEQILSSHSLVDATQELDEIASIVRTLNGQGQPEQEQYPRSIENLGSGVMQDMAQRYLEYARPYRKQAPYFIDKAPQNFQHIGLIKTLFPNAKIIDIRRNPMASGWSQYRQFFADSFQFSYKLETIGRYYNDYLDLMNHWHAVLPRQILTVQYEELVDKFPQVVEEVLRYCGLKFEDACLDFHLNKRAVATPSSEQVRQPLYSNALEHWKNYESFLGPLKRIVESSDLPTAS